jgi:micrococcal nuclease
MRNNVYGFRQSKWADPKRLKMIASIKPKRRASRYLSGLIVLFIAVGIVLVQAWPTIVGSLEPIGTKSVDASSAISVRVIDGDTIGLNDGRSDVRLIGFNAPETGTRARCDAERSKGEAAKSRLRELVSRGSLGFQQVACSCPPGTEGTNACNFGRRCGTLTVGGRDVGSILIGEGLAARFTCGATSCPPLPRPWR